MRVVFFGTSDYCLPVLESLHQNFDLKLVVTRPDKPVGRKKTLTSSATKLWAEKNHVPVITPATLKKDTSDRSSLLSLFSDLNPDLAIVSDYGLIIPQAIFDLPKLGTVNIHFSKLPDLRGPSPVQFTLLRGDQEAWITFFKLENPPELEIKMDSGPVLLQKSYPILPDDTTQSLYAHLFQEAAKELPKVIHNYSLHCSDPTFLMPQDHSKATYSRFLTRDDGFIEWKVLNNPRTLFNRYRAMFPWPGLWTIVPNHVEGSHKNKRMKILMCHLEADKLILDEVQLEGEKPKSPSQGLPLPLCELTVRPR